MEYVIYLSTESLSNPTNDYGYWAGKTYTVDGETFPYWDSKVTSRTKRYKSKARAESMARKLFDRCGYAMTWSVLPINQRER